METLSIKETIKSVLNDICDAVEEVRSNKGYVAPASNLNRSSPAAATNVEFDLAVTIVEEASSGSNTNAGLGVQVIGLRIGGEQTDESSAQNLISKISRVKFSVPVYFQYDAYKKPR